MLKRIMLMAIIGLAGCDVLMFSPQEQLPPCPPIRMKYDTLTGTLYVDTTVAITDSGSIRVSTKNCR